MASRAANRAEEKVGAGEEGRSGYILENQVGHLLRRAHQRHTAIFQANVGEEQLTPLQFAALMKLADVGETSQNQLGRRTAMDAATMQGVIKRLISRGLLNRRPDPNDRRRLLLTLSAAGEKMVDGVRDIGFRITDQTLEPFSRAERETFIKLLRRLSD